MKQVYIDKTKGSTKLSKHQKIMVGDWKGTFPAMLKSKAMPILSGGLLVASTLCSYAQKAGAFSLADVRLLEGPFKHAQDLDLKYILALEPDRLLAPFRKDAGLEAKAQGYPNWESTGLDGHTAGHYLSALAMMYASTGNKEILQRLNYMVSVFAECQTKNGNGYVGGIPDAKKMWNDVAAGNLTVDNFSVNKRWVPWYNIHKLYAGLRDAYWFAGNNQAKEVLVKLSDWSYSLLANLTDEQIQKMLRAEHGGMNEVFADVFQITGDKKYLELARRFSHKLILEPLAGHNDKLNGLHANTQIPKVIGFERISELTGDTVYHSAAEFFWETVVNNRSVAIGGNSVREHFHPSTDFTTMVEDKEGPETCNTYNMLKLSKMLYAASCSAKYIDYYERGLYNHILSSQHPVHGGFVYFTPMRPQHYRVYSQPQQCFWCCVGSGIENHSKYGELIYAHTENDLFVNLFIASKLTWKEKGLTLVQETSFPESETTVIKLQTVKQPSFTMHIRFPGWVQPGRMRVLVNGKEEKVSALPTSYLAIKRKWKSGDEVTIQLPMQLSAEYLPDHSPWASFLYGPVVLAAKTDTANLTGLIANDSRMGHVAAGKFYPMEKAPMIVTASKDFSSQLKPIPGKKLTFSAAGIISPESYKNLEFIPFYKLHDARYMIYWRVTTPEELEKIQQAAREKEQARLALEAQTIDQVAPGEQQPESDHNMQSEQSATGVHMDMHWRDARGWFSYDLKDKHNEAAIIQVKYFGADRGRSFNIVLNDTIIAAQSLEGKNGNQFFTVDYPIPANCIKNSPNAVYTIKFVAKPGSVAGGVYYVRLLKKALPAEEKK